ncbi:hypothetical protein ACFQO1_04770 [Jejudonia soesokkakensis]|uniref:Uncharacterized protein n=1 Tax=Jejudonia soesokkakensis TaxID=1323432 RepID=A0ABW2MQI8_9FLAO
MRVVLFLFFGIFYTFCNSAAQEKQLVPIDYNVVTNIPKDDLINAVSSVLYNLRGIENKTWCDGEKCKVNKIYNKISILNNKSEPILYAKGSLRVASGEIAYTFDGNTAIYYKDTNQLFGNVTYTDKGFINFKDHAVTLFHKNGNILLETIPEGTNQAYERGYDEDGQLIYSILRDYSENELEYKPAYYDVVNHGTILFKERRPKILASSKKLHFINHKENGVYMGNRYFGTYTTASAIDITGFLLTTIESLGNGSVVFVSNNEENGSGYFTIYFNGQLDERYKTLETSLDITTFVENLIETTAVTDTYKDWRGYTYSMPVYKIKTNNLEAHVGYGIDYFTKQIQKNINEYQLKIGFYKNGKLNGLGYKVKLTQAVDGIWSYQDVAYEYGFFEEDVLIQGETYKKEGKMNEKNWTARDSRFKYTSRDSIKGTYSKKGIALSELNLKKDTLVYMPSVNGILKLDSIDITNKKLFVREFYNRNTLDKTALGLVELSLNEQLFLMETEDSGVIVGFCYACNGAGTLKNEFVKTFAKPGLRGNVRNGLVGYFDPSTNSYYYLEKKKVIEYIECKVCKGERISKATVAKHYMLYPIVN